jgi:hypothetical protein
MVKPPPLPEPPPTDLRWFLLFPVAALLFEEGVRLPYDAIHSPHLLVPYLTARWLFFCSPVVSTYAIFKLAVFIAGQW